LIRPSFFFWYYIIRAENNICARKRGRDKDFITCQQKKNSFLWYLQKKRGKGSRETYGFPD
jgi:hypothetical protein